MTNKPTTYQELQDELQAIAEKLESTDIDIEEATKTYERGTQIIKQLKERLAVTENKIKTISQKQ